MVEDRVWGIPTSKSEWKSRCPQKSLTEQPKGQGKSQETLFSYKQRKKFVVFSFQCCRRD